MIYNASDYKFVTGITNGEVLINGQVLPVRKLLLANDENLTGTAHPKCIRGEDKAFLAEATLRRLACLTNNPPNTFSFPYLKSITKYQLNWIGNNFLNFIPDSTWTPNKRAYNYKDVPFWTFGTSNSLLVTPSRAIFINPSFVFNTQGGEWCPPTNTWNGSTQDEFDDYNSWWYARNSPFFGYGSNTNYWISQSNLESKIDQFNNSALDSTKIQKIFNDLPTTKKFFNGCLINLKSAIGTPELVWTYSANNIQTTEYGPDIPEGGASAPWVGLGNANFANTLFSFYTNVYANNTKMYSCESRISNCSLTVDISDIISRTKSLMSNSVVCLVRLECYFISVVMGEASYNHWLYATIPWTTTFSPSGKITIPNTVWQEGIRLLRDVYQTNFAYKPGNGTIYNYSTGMDITPAKIAIIHSLNGDTDVPTSLG